MFLEAMAFAKPVIGQLTEERRISWSTVSMVFWSLPATYRNSLQRLASLLTNDTFRATLGRHGADLVRKKYRSKTSRVS